MSLRTLSQASFFDPEFVMPGALEPGTLPWLLGRYRSLVLPSWLFKGWRGEGQQGRDAWPPQVLMVLMLLRWVGEGMSRRQSAKTAESDAVWRAAMGLQFGAPTPSEKTLREFERFLQGQHPDADRPRYLVLNEHVVRLCVENGLGGKDAVWGTDSTPMWCYGQVIDTLRLLGDGVRKLAGLWARATAQGVLAVAEEWELSKLIGAKSTKGGLGVEIRDKEGRAKALDSLADAVMKATAYVREHADELSEVAPRKRKEMLKLARHLLLVITQNLDRETMDGKERWVMARKVAPDRIASLTDPEARHGRKSASQTYTGFKIHVLGDCVSGLIASLTVTKGNQHDATVTPRLVARAKELVDAFDVLLADTAYGGAELRHNLAFVAGVRVVAPPPPISQSSERYTKHDFEIDFETKQVTCPNGEVAPEQRSAAGPDVAVPDAMKFKWTRAQCDECPVRIKCLDADRRTKTIELHPFERELRKAREDWKDPDVREAYKRRNEHERLVNQLTRHGGRRARAWGLKAANLQAHAIAASTNLTLLARRLAALEKQAQQERTAA